MCWSDFTDVDFRGADLSRCDMRASQFERVSFQGTVLDRADLRHSWFGGCSFNDARMTGALLTRTQGRSLPLSIRQQADIDWRDEDGDEPMGG